MTMTVGKSDIAIQIWFKFTKWHFIGLSHACHHKTMLRSCYFGSSYCYYTVMSKCVYDDDDDVLQIVSKEFTREHLEWNLFSAKTYLTLGNNYFHRCKLMLPCSTEHIRRCIHYCPHTNYLLHLLTIPRLRFPIFFPCHHKLRMENIRRKKKKKNNSSPSQLEIDFSGQKKIILT